MFWQWEADGLADIYYFDETGFSLTPQVPYAWQSKGKSTLEIPSSRSQRLNLLGFLNRDNIGVIKTVAGSVTSEVIIDFFDQFAAQHAARSGTVTKPCIIILDNASMHRSKAFKARRDS